MSRASCSAASRLRTSWRFRVRRSPSCHRSTPPVSSTPTSRPPAGPAPPTPPPTSTPTTPDMPGKGAAPAPAVTARRDPAPYRLRNGVKSVSSRAPLRLGFGGGGSDVSPYCDRYGGYVLNATIDRYCSTTIAHRDDGRVVLAASDLGRETVLDDLGSGDLPVHAAAYNRLCD